MLPALKSNNGKCFKIPLPVIFNPLSTLKEFNSAYNEPVSQKFDRTSPENIPVLPTTLLVKSNVVNNSFDSTKISCIKSKSEISPSDVRKTFTLLTSPANVSKLEIFTFAKD